MDEDNFFEEEQNDVKCPVCNSNLFYTQIITDIAFERRILIQTYYCKKCLFKRNSVIPLDSGKAVRIRYEVSRAEDLRTIVYRSPDARITIPEINGEIEPGTISDGEVTTVEGVITRLSENMLIAIDENDETAKEKMKFLKDFSEGKRIPFTLIIEDESGLSTVRSPRAITEILG
ncbi:ZPR1 zinc finger domain-containing protein [Caldiplasma sukawensis]